MMESHGTRYVESLIPESYHLLLLYGFSVHWLGRTTRVKGNDSV